MFKEEIRKYYSKVKIFIPNIRNREFGFGFKFKKIDIRHKKFDSNEDFNIFLRTQTPRYVSFSCAYYEYPDARPMENKEYRGRDLVIDIDVDELGLDYIINKYSITYCKNCNLVFKDLRPVCQKCGERTKKILFYADELDEICKKVVEEVYNILIEELGFDKNKLKIKFSGSRGYHIHYFEKLELDENSLRCLANYITMQNFDFKKFFKYDKTEHVYFGPPYKDIKLGEYVIKWPIRIGKKIIDNIEHLVSETGKITIVKNLLAKGYYPIGKKYFKVNRLNDLKEYIPPFNKIDIQTFIDKYRLIRAPNTIHGDTMMIAKTINNYKEFNPWKNAILHEFKYVNCYVPYLPSGRYGGKEYEEIKDSEIKLPKYLAMYLSCRFERNLIKEN